MPFLYDVWNVKLQQWAKGLVWSRGGKHFSKTFSIFYMLNSKNRIFNPYFWIDACRMRKILLRIIREFNLLSFWWKNNRFLWNFCLAIFMGNPSLKLSEVLVFMNLIIMYLGSLKILLRSNKSICCGDNLTTDWDSQWFANSNLVKTVPCWMKN